MASKIASLLVAMFVLTICGRAHAQNLDGTPLESCPEYKKDYRIVSELRWSVGCFLQAIHDGNKDILAVLSPLTRCREGFPCDGSLEASSADLFFGSNGTGKTESGTPSLSARLAKAKSIWIIADPDLQRRNTVTVRFILKPGKSAVRALKGIDRDFFETDFIYDEKLSIWVDSSSFHFETDYLQDAYDLTDVVDLSGDQAALPIMIWKPKKQSATK